MLNLLSIPSYFINTWIRKCLQTIATVALALSIGTMTKLPGRLVRDSLSIPFLSDVKDDLTFMYYESRF